VALFLVSVQTNDNVVRSSKSEGFRIASNIILRSRDKPDINAGLLDEYPSMVLLRHFANLRSDVRLTNKEVLLLMVSCSLQMGEETFQTFAVHDVKTLTFQLYAINCFQWLDLCLVGVLQRNCILNFCFTVKIQPQFSSRAFSTP
jgi:hypothetical protein